MPRVVVPDASNLIVLQKIGELYILQQLYGTIYSTKEVASEFGLELPDWIEIVSAQDKKHQRFLETQVDQGEASALAFASETEDCLLIVDDLKARKLTKQLNLKITGTLGVIHMAKEIGIIPFVRPVIDKLMATDFRISKRIVEELLKRNNE